MKNNKEELKSWLVGHSNQFKNKNMNLYKANRFLYCTISNKTTSIQKMASDLAPFVLVLELKPLKKCYFHVFLFFFPKQKPMLWATLFLGAPVWHRLNLPALSGTLAILPSASCLGYQKSSNCITPLMAQIVIDISE